MKTKLLILFLFLAGCSDNPTINTTDPTTSHTKPQLSKAAQELQDGAFEAGMLSAIHAYLIWQRSYITNGQAPPSMGPDVESWEAAVYELAKTRYPYIKRP